jgi:uncharacterized protein
MLKRVVSMVLASAALLASGAATAQPSLDFFRAVARDDVAAMRSAMLRGISANARDADGTPALVIAAREKSWNTLRALAELRGTDVEAADSLGSNALMFAALHGELPMIRFLVSRDAVINREGWTALHFAAANGHVEVIRYLLEQHAYIDAESPNRTTPLMMAARQGKPAAAMLLLEEGADPTIRNEAGFTASDYARMAGDQDLSRTLAARAQDFARRYGVPASR